MRLVHHHQMSFRMPEMSRYYRYHHKYFENNRIMKAAYYDIGVHIYSQSCFLSLGKYIFNPLAGGKYMHT
jgi:hypothetical protein